MLLLLQLNQLLQLQLLVMEHLLLHVQRQAGLQRREVLLGLPLLALLALLGSGGLLYSRSLRGWGDVVRELTGCARTPLLRWLLGVYNSGRGGLRASASIRRRSREGSGDGGVAEDAD